MKTRCISNGRGRGGTAPQTARGADTPCPPFAHSIPMLPRLHCPSTAGQSANCPQARTPRHATPPHATPCHATPRHATRAPEPARVEYGLLPRASQTQFPTAVRRRRVARRRTERGFPPATQYLMQRAVRRMFWTASGWQYTRGRAQSNESVGFMLRKIHPRARHESHGCRLTRSV
jgi:hypothetical protein